MFPQYWPQDGWMSRSDWYAAFAKVAKKDPTLLTGRPELPGGRRGCHFGQGPQDLHGNVRHSAAADAIWIEASKGRGRGQVLRTGFDQPLVRGHLDVHQSDHHVAPYSGSRYEAARMFKAFRSDGFKGLKQAIKDDHDHLLQVTSPAA